MKLQRVSYLGSQEIRFIQSDFFFLMDSVFYDFNTNVSTTVSN